MSRRPRPRLTPAPVARPEELRLLEALLFAAREPLDEATLARRLPNGVNVKNTLAQLKDEYATRGVNLVRVGKKWTLPHGQRSVVATDEADRRNAQAFARCGRNACHYCLSSAGDSR